MYYIALAFYLSIGLGVNSCLQSTVLPVTAQDLETSGFARVELQTVFRLYSATTYEPVGRDCIAREIVAERA